MNEFIDNLILLNWGGGEGYLNAEGVHHDELEEVVGWQDLFERNSLSPDCLTGERRQVPVQRNVETHLIRIRLQYHHQTFQIIS